MKNILPRLTTLIRAVAAIAMTAFASFPASNPAAGAPGSSSSDASATPGASTPIAAQPITAGDQLLLQAIAQLERRESIAARLQYKASLNGQTLSNASYPGSYWQQGSGDVLRVRLELRVTDTISLLQVSNGRFLWVDRQFPTRRVVNRLDLRRIRADAARAAAKLDELQPGQANWSPIHPELSAYYGGLPKLLSAMSESFTFQQPQAMRLELKSPDKAVKSAVPVFAVVGHWKPAQLAKIVPPLGEAGIDAELERQLAALPSRLPQEVLLLLGQADLFPYRIEYRTLMQPSPSAGMPAAPYQLSAEPLVLVEFSDVSFDVPIGPGQFDYAPPSDTKWDDLTAEYLDKIRSQRDQQLATRNREPTL